MYKIYQIGNGETVDEIANLFKVDTDDLKKINGIEDNMTLTPGSFIIVPDFNVRKSIDEDYVDYTVKVGDTMYSISQKYNVDLLTLFKLNGLEESDYIYPDEIIKIPNTMNKIYITKKGDTIKTIEEKLNESIDKLNKDTIYVVEDQLIKLN